MPIFAGTPLNYKKILSGKGRCFSPSFFQCRGILRGGGPCYLFEELVECRFGVETVLEGENRKRIAVPLHTVSSCFKKFLSSESIYIIVELFFRTAVQNFRETVRGQPA